jgi:hypothetical protein
MVNDTVKSMVNDESFEKKTDEEHLQTPEAYSASSLGGREWDLYLACSPASINHTASLHCTHDISRLLALRCHDQESALSCPSISHKLRTSGQIFTTNGSTTKIYFKKCDL